MLTKMLPEAGFTHSGPVCCRLGAHLELLQGSRSHRRGLLCCGGVHIARRPPHGDGLPQQLHLEMQVRRQVSIDNSRPTSEHPALQPTPAWCKRCAGRPACKPRAGLEATSDEGQGLQAWTPPLTPAASNMHCALQLLETRCVGGTGAFRAALQHGDCPAHLAAQLQRRGRHLGRAQLHESVPPLAVHRHVHHRIQPRHHLRVSREGMIGRQLT